MRQDVELEAIATVVDHARRENRDLISPCGYVMYCQRAAQHISDALPEELVNDALDEFEILEAQNHREVNS